MKLLNINVYDMTVIYQTIPCLKPSTLKSVSKVLDYLQYQPLEVDLKYKKQKYEYNSLVKDVKGCCVSVGSMSDL